MKQDTGVMGHEESITIDVCNEVPVETNKDREIALLEQDLKVQKMMMEVGRKEALIMKVQLNSGSIADKVTIKRNKSSTTSKTVQNRQGGKIDEMFCPIFPQQYKDECLVDTMREYHTEYTITSMIVHKRQCRKMD